MTAIHDRWAALLADFDASGVTVLGFCQRRGISAASFYRWRRLLRADRGGMSGKAFFVEALVRHAEHAAPVVELGHRFRVEIPPGFDDATVVRLLLLLERMGASPIAHGAPDAEARR